MGLIYNSNDPDDFDSEEFAIEMAIDAAEQAAIEDEDPPEDDETALRRAFDEAMDKDD